MGKGRMVNTGLLLTPGQDTKSKRLAENLGVSRNRLIGLLIDEAEVEALPRLAIGAKKNNRQAATNLTETGSLAIAEPSSVMAL